MFLALYMVVTMLPVSAMAEEAHTTIGLMRGNHQLCAARRNRKNSCIRHVH